MRATSQLGNRQFVEQGQGLVFDYLAKARAVETSRPGDEHRQYSVNAFGAVFAEVAVDQDLGLIRVRRILGAYGVGRIVNPTMAHSQMISGMVGGIGMALMEQTIVDRKQRTDRERHSRRLPDACACRHPGFGRDLR